MSGKANTPEGVREVTDLEMMENPEWWPNGFYLPLKQPKWRTAVLMSWDTDVYLLWEDMTMFDKLPTDKAERLNRDQLQSVIDRGWVVD